MKLIFLFFTTFLFCSATWACPIKPQDSELTFQRVMINFGKYTSTADRVASEGAADPLAVVDSDLKKAIEELAIARSCSQAVLQKPEGALLPDTFHKLPDEEKPAYLKKMLGLMKQFDVVLMEMKEEFVVQLNKNSSMRNFQKSLIYSDELNDLANLGHESTH